MHTYILVLEIDQMEENKLYVPKLHCTIVHWFYWDKEPSEIVRLLSPIFGAAHLQKLTSGASTFLGESNTIPVHLVEKTKPMTDLHEALTSLLDQQGAKYLTPEYVKDGWKPHVTNQEGREFTTGTEYETHAAYLIEAIGDIDVDPKNVLVRIEIGNE